MARLLAFFVSLLCLQASLRALDHAAWQRLLQTHVDERGLVAYAAWKNSPAELAALDAYLAQFADASFDADARNPAAIAALINFYNAATIRLILDHYPLKSIRDLPDPWKTARWPLGGARVSLDHVEHELLRPRFGWRTHAALVCAALSCPPLQRDAYTPENLDTLTTRALTAWLARPDLNRYDPAQNKIEVSQIFDWFKADFTGEGSLDRLLIAYAPPARRAFFEKRAYTVGFAPYDWSLNAQPGP